MLAERNYYKEIGWLLLIKFIVIMAIRFLFFSHPHAKLDGDTTSEHLLGASAPAVQTTNNNSQEAP